MTNWKKNRIYTLLKDCLSKDGEIYELIIPSDLYDVRLALPENFIRCNADNDFSQKRNKSSKKEEVKFIVNEQEKTYWNKEYSKYLQSKKKNLATKLKEIKNIKQLYNHLK